MLCEISVLGNFWVTWMSLSLIALVMVMVMSGYLFKLYYYRPTYEQWLHKSNREYPSPGMVRSEVLKMLNGMFVATLCPTLSLYLAQHGYSQAYCGVHPHGWGHLAFSFVAVWLVSDLYEFAYHYLGHTTSVFWGLHKSHHIFYNPSPFAVIADDRIDQFFRSLPMLAFPLVMPMNIDLIFFEFGLFFYGYGVYLHWGHEFDALDAHHPWINTSFQHYLHHAKSIANKPYHTGFFFKLWDQLAGTTYPGKCFCCKCSAKAGERTREIFDSIVKPDYSVLLKPGFWLNPEHYTDTDTKKKPARAH